MMIQKHVAKWVGGLVLSVAVALPAGAISLQQVIDDGGFTTANGVTFSNFSVSITGALAGSLTASQLELTFEGSGGSAGFSLTGPISAADGELGDVFLSFSVSSEQAIVGALLSALNVADGGLGALALGERLARQDRPVPVLAVSPALWPDYGQVMPGSFDDEGQYAEMMALVRDRLARDDVRVDCGTADPFYRDVRTVVPDAVEQHYSRGEHTAAYWPRELPAQLDWLADRIR